MDTLDGDDLPPPAYEAALLAYRHSLRRLPTSYGHGGSSRRPSASSSSDWETGSTSTSSASREDDTASSSLSGTGVSEKQRMGRLFLANAEGGPTPLPTEDAPPAPQQVPIQPLRPRRRGPRSLPGLPTTVEEVPVPVRVVPNSPPPPITPISPGLLPSPFDDLPDPTPIVPSIAPDSHSTPPSHLRPAPPFLSTQSSDSSPSRFPRQSLYEDDSTPVTARPPGARPAASACTPKANAFYNSSIAAHMEPVRSREPLPRVQSHGMLTTNPYGPRSSASHSTLSFASSYTAVAPVRPASSMSTSSNGSYGASSRSSHYDSYVRR